jgi:hypothetical protein
MPIFVDDFGCIFHSFEAKSWFYKRKKQKTLASLAVDLRRDTHQTLASLAVDLRRDTHQIINATGNCWMNPRGAEA